MEITPAQIILFYKFRTELSKGIYRPIIIVLNISPTFTLQGKVSKTNLATVLSTDIFINTYAEMYITDFSSL